ncbi:MAG: amidohydrolase family protein [Planctomycetales bacterium]|nr:amidohydrolase family protein [Planctomycetales bacterium]
MTRTDHMTRREALATGAAVGLAALTAPALAGADDTPWIDAHSHIWPPETDKFPLAAGQTKKDLNPPSFTDDELMAIARPEGVGRVVLIQHSVYHLFDNSYLIDAVRRHPQRFRIQGMIDDHQPHAGAAMKKLLPQGVTGFRITPFVRKQQDQAKWLETSGMIEMWKTGAETRQAMCLLINASDLPATDAMCERHPDTPVVIDHFARIGVDGQFHEDDLKALCRLARHKHASVKISAYYALGQKKPPHLELIPMIKRLYDTFGPQRLMWASDSPYQIQGVNNYKASISLARDRLDFVSAEDRQWLLRKTAEKVFFYT